MALKIDPAERAHMLWESITSGDTITDKAIFLRVVEGGIRMAEAVKQAEIDPLRTALTDARQKLALYYEASDKNYVGGVEYGALMQRIEALLGPLSS